MFIEKRKVKEFLEDYSGEIIFGVGLLAIAGVSYLCKKSYINGVTRGAGLGFQEGINWFDSNFENLNLRGLWNEWAIANPERVVNV